jgi:hypothetical protein
MVPDLLHANEEMRGKAHRIVASLHDVIQFLDDHARQAGADRT